MKSVELPVPIMPPFTSPMARVVVVARQFTGIVRNHVDRSWWRAVWSHSVVTRLSPIAIPVTDGNIDGNTGAAFRRESKPNEDNCGEHELLHICLS
jgi:hypothetical protein